jgi:uncharacterized membrane protein YfcA
MTDWVWLASVASGAVVGFSLGLTGAGGSMLAVPLLVYGLSVEPHAALGISLAAVGIAALVGFFARLARNEVDLWAALLVSPAGMAGAPIGTWFRAKLPAESLMVSFAAVMLVVAARMWFAEPAADERIETAVPPPSRSALLFGAAGLLAGVFSGLFGVGGAIVIVPALVFVGGLPIRRAVATSLLVVALVSLSGVVSHIAVGQPIASHVAPWFVAGGMVGALSGHSVAGYLPGLILQRLFALLVVAVALLMLLRATI